MFGFKPLVAFAAILLFAFPGHAAPPEENWNDRAVAEWVLRMGGTVVIAGQTARISDLTQLPASDFRLHAVDVVSVLISPSEFKRFENLTELKELYLCGRTWHSLPINVSRDNFKSLERLTNSRSWC